MSISARKSPSLFSGPPADAAGVAAAPPAGPGPGPLGLCVLGSGSGGNSSVVRLGTGAMLIDAGFGPRTTSRRLGQLGLNLGDLAGICLTHLDQDHFRPTWMASLIEYSIPLLLHQWHVDNLAQIEGSELLWRHGLVRPFQGESFAPLPGVAAKAIHLAHDTKGSSGFLLLSSGGSLGYATDLGHVPTELLRQFRGVDLLAIESNYDPQMQLASNRPLFLKRRIMGQAGHLSNEQAFAAVKAILDASPAGTPQHVVLLHRSQQCNCPTLVQRVFAQDARIAARLTLTEQRRRTRWLYADPGAAQPQQLSLF